jgi:hypothetical protein
MDLCIIGIIKQVRPELTMEQVNSIVNFGPGPRGEEHDPNFPYNINLGGRMKSRNAPGMEIGLITGNQGNNYITAYSSYDEQKIAAHLQEGDIIRLSSYYSPHASPEYEVIDINLPTITLDGTLQGTYYTSTPPTGHESSFLILISKDDSEVPTEHPMWGHQLDYSYSFQEFINAGNSSFAGGGSSGLNIVPVGWIQQHRFHPAPDHDWFPELNPAYQALNTRFWTSTGYKANEEPYLWPYDNPPGDLIDPWPFYGVPAAIAWWFRSTESGSGWRYDARFDGLGVRCVKE